MSIRPITAIGLALAVFSLLFTPHPIAIILGVSAIIVGIIGIFTAKD